MPFDRDKLAVLVSLIVLGWGASDVAHAAPEPVIDTETPIESLALSGHVSAQPSAALTEWACHETLLLDADVPASIGDAPAARNDAAPSEGATESLASAHASGGAVSEVVPDEGLASADTRGLARTLAGSDNTEPARLDAAERDAGAPAAEPEPVEVARTALTRFVAQRADEARPRADALVETTAIDADDEASQPWLRVAAVLTDVEPQVSFERQALIRRAAAPISTPATASKAAAPEVLIAGHAERVLMGLAALRNPQRAHARPSAEPRETVVATQAEKVLTTLEVVRAARDVQAARFDPPDLLLEPMPAPVHASAATAVEEAVVPTRSASETRLGAIERWAERAQRAALVDMKDERIVSKPVALAGARRRALGDHDLDQVRGGFDNGTGLKVSFGIERAVYINGSLVANSTLSVTELGKLAGGDVRASSSDAAGLTLVQNGAGNVVATTSGTTGLGTVIQNSLNDQNIRNVTVINAAVNSAQLARGLALHSTLRNVAIDALRR